MTTDTKSTSKRSRKTAAPDEGDAAQAPTVVSEAPTPPQEPEPPAKPIQVAGGAKIDLAATEALQSEQASAGAVGVGDRVSYAVGGGVRGLTDSIGARLPAVVVRKVNEQVVNLQVFADSEAGCRWVRNVPFGDGPGTWRW